MMPRGPLVLVLALALTSGYLGMRLHAEQRSNGLPSPPSHPLVQLVGMTPEQTQQLAALEKQFIVLRDPLRGKILAQRADIYELLQAEHPDQARIEADIQTISALQTQVQREVAAHLLRVKDILNETQRRQFFAALAVTMCPAAVGSSNGPCLNQPAYDAGGASTAGHGKSGKQ
jgi:Spy/CpxP family protein refolding chaperone